MSTVKHKSVSELRRIIASPHLYRRAEREEALRVLRARQRTFRSVAR